MATYTVNTALDCIDPTSSSTISLRDAIRLVNASTDPENVIAFAPSLAGKTITALSPMPSITVPIKLDGSKSPGVTIKGNLRVTSGSEADFGVSMVGVSSYNDEVITGQHNDTVVVSGNFDNFVFNKHFGHDKIVGFTVEGSHHDVVTLPSSEFATIAQVLRDTTMSGGNAVIHATPNDTITLVGVTKAELKAHQNVFQFH